LAGKKKRPLVALRRPYPLQVFRRRPEPPSDGGEKSVDSLSVTVETEGDE